MTVPGKRRASGDHTSRDGGEIGLDFLSFPVQFVLLGASGACRRLKGAPMERMRSHWEVIGMIKVETRQARHRRRSPGLIARRRRQERWRRPALAFAHRLPAKAQLGQVDTLSL